VGGGLAQQKDLKNGYAPFCYYLPVYYDNVAHENVGHDNLRFNKTNVWKILEIS
jgi:hypothetical protein